MFLGVRPLLEILSSNPSIDSLMTAFNKVTIPDVPSAISDQAEDSADDVSIVRVDLERPSQKRSVADSVLNFSQLRVLELRQCFKLTRGVSNGILEMVQDPRFDPSELGTTKVQRLERALLREYGGKVTEYDFHTPEDGKQDLKMYLLCIRQVAEEIFSDPAFKDALILTFTPTFDENGNRTFGSAMGGVWAQFAVRALIDGQDVLLALVIFIDATYLKVNLTVKPIYGMPLLNLTFITFLMSQPILFLL
jgi:hypothetical protein